MSTDHFPGPDPYSNPFSAPVIQPRWGPGGTSEFPTDEAIKAGHEAGLASVAEKTVSRFAGLSEQEAADVLYREWLRTGSDMLKVWSSGYLRFAEKIGPESSERARAGARVLWEVAYQRQFLGPLQEGIRNALQQSRPAVALHLLQGHLARIQEIEARVGRLDIPRPRSEDVDVLRKLSTWEGVRFEREPKPEPPRKSLLGRVLGGK